MQLGRILLLIILLFAQVPSIAEEMDLSECKNWSTADWDHYLQQFFSPPGTGPLWRMTDEYNSVLVDGAKKACPENFSRPEIQKCTRRMKDYYEMLGKTSRFDSFSYLMSDKDYYAKQPKDKMDLPPELQSSSHGLPKNWRAVAKERGWNWILFQSTTGSPGNHESRLIMIVPQKGSTQLLLYYGRDGEKDPTKFSGLQAQVIENSKNGVELKNPIVHYRAWTFDGPQEKPKLRTESWGNGEKCIHCHLNGPRSIVPLRGSHYATEMSNGKTLAEINKLVVLNAVPDTSMIYDMSKFPSHLQVGDQDRCTDCHNGHDRSSLAFNIGLSGMWDAQEIMNRKVLVDGTMPQHPLWEVSQKERAGIPERVEKEYSIAIQQWLTETKCDSHQKSAPASAEGAAAASNGGDSAKAGQK